MYGGGQLNIQVWLRVLTTPNSHHHTVFKEVCMGFFDWLFDATDFSTEEERDAKETNTQNTNNSKYGGSDYNYGTDKDRSSDHWEHDVQ